MPPTRIRPHSNRIATGFLMSAPVSLQVIVGLLIFASVYVPLERMFPRRQQSPFRPGWSTDVAYYVIGCFVGKLSDTTSWAAMLVLREATGLGFGKIAAAQPTWIQFVELVLTADFCAYWFHRVLHRNTYLWQLHRIHHTSERMDWLANVRLHPIDKMLGDCVQFTPIFCLGFSTTAVLSYTIFLGFQGFLNHSNIKLDFGRLRWIIASPQFHHWHHCNDPNLENRNFSAHLVVFDMLFGTFYLPPDSSTPVAYGIPDPSPRSLLRQTIAPFFRARGSAPRDRATAPDLRS